MYILYSTEGSYRYFVFICIVAEDGHLLLRLQRVQAGAGGGQQRHPHLPHTPHQVSAGQTPPQ